MKQASLDLAAAAVADVLEKNPPDREFHVLRTGGVENAADLRASESAGAPLSQWYSGYFEAFARHGHRVYRDLYRDLLSDRGPLRPSPGDASLSLETAEPTRQTSTLGRKPCSAPTLSRHVEAREAFGVGVAVPFAGTTEAAFAAVSGRAPGAASSRRRPPASQTSMAGPKP